MAGEPVEFRIGINSTQGGLDEPSATITLPANTTLDAVTIEGDPVDCDPPAAGQVTCRLPSGITSAILTVTVTPMDAAIGDPMTLGISAQALNAPQTSGSAESPPVQPPL